MTVRGSGWVRWVLAAAAVALLPSVGAAQTPAIDAAREYRSQNAPRILREYAELLRMPNVASDADNIRRNAEHIAGLFGERGVRMELLELDGAPPLVFGELTVPGATRTLGIYVHYDGQPVAAGQWTHGPWEPTLYTGSMEAGGEPRGFPDDGEEVDPEWRIYARSASDDKAPIPALLASLDALEAAEIPLTSNIKFLFEGEEEAGSAHLSDYIDRYGDRFGVDVWLFCDGPVHQSGRPQLTFGVRGVTGLQVTVYGATRSLHSGHYGSWVPQPAQMLTELLASMKDASTGEVLIEGFYDSVDPIGGEEREALEALPSQDEELMRELGIGWHEGPEDEGLEERILLPSLNLKGISSGNVGADARNVIPNTATAALGIRMVAGNDPEEMKDLVEAHIRSRGYHIVREDPDMETRLAHDRIAKVTRGGGYPAARTSMALPVVRSVIGAARQAAGDELILLPTLGGSLPLFYFTDVMGAPAAIVPIANHDNNQHAPDENLRIQNLWYGIDLYAALLTMDQSQGGME